MNHESDNSSDLSECPLHRKTPYVIKNVSSSQLSIARHYGGIAYNGCNYIYFPESDELIRDDVLAWQKTNDDSPKKSLFRLLVQSKVQRCAKGKYGRPESEWRKYQGINDEQIKELKKLGVVDDDYPFKNLSSRVESILEHNGIHTREAAIEALRTGRLSRKTNNYGEKSYKILREFLGVDVPEKGGPGPWKYNPYTGKRLNK